MADKVRWEYKAVEVTWHSRMAGPPVGEMNRLGGDGWEMAGYSPFPNGTDGPGKSGPCGWFWFKRPKG